MHSARRNHSDPLRRTIQAFLFSYSSSQLNVERAQRQRDSLRLCALYLLVEQASTEIEWPNNKRYSVLEVSGVSSLGVSTVSTDSAAPLEAAAAAIARSPRVSRSRIRAALPRSLRR